MSINYKGYEIRPASMQLKDNKEWNISVYIAKHYDDETKMKSFSASNTFPTKKQAEEQCILFAKEIIDGKHENLTLEDV